MAEGDTLSGKPQWLILLELAPVEWERAVDLLSQEDKARVGDKLYSLAQKAAFLAEYLSVRHMDGGHELAVKRGNAALRGVRRALGYSYPAEGQINV